MTPTFFETLRGLVWAVDQLQKLIPDGSAWDNRAQSIADKKAAAQHLLEQMQTADLPYIATRADGTTFAPTMIDYVGRQVRRKNPESSGAGEWVPFSEVTITPNPFYNKAF